MKKIKGYQVALAGLLTFAGLTQEAKALPMFTTQTGMDCTGCHTQIMPRLNKFGRKFAASGMTMSQQVENMDINPSVLIKSKYAKTWDKPDGKGAIKEGDTNDGDFSHIRMATIYLGGRLTENIGGTLNLGYRQHEGRSISGRVTYANAVEDGYWGITAYSNNSQGPFSGMEFYNTGLYKPLRMFDNKVYSNAAQTTKAYSKGATGLQLYYDRDNLLNSGDHFFITAGIYTPTQDNAYIDMNDNILPFARIAYEHPIGDYNVMLGAFIISGGDTVTDTETLSMKRETYGFDIQIEGDIADREASLTVTNILKNKIEFTGIGAQSDDSDTEDSYNSAFSVEGAISITPTIVTKVGYMTYNDEFDYRYTGKNSRPLKINAKDLDSAINVGLDYGFNLINKDMKLAVEYAWMNPSLDRVENYQSFMTTLTLPF
ncbi:hypothetical protein MN086_05820 [Sulfurovum sp. XGS-02]|uniref:hypothetical protein n=1 Tax=Sulfurovum sp. XGS-02 TaxID=2925411 RepID=UPI00205CD33F|nr:hypothetical protein [Sulfurovum sp. XGS-02]UPT76570.1 hypothetical protein MN086_05820 [Sulfurovum sp. XGS-02]